MAPQVTAFRVSASYLQDFQAAPVDVKKAVESVLRKLIANSNAGSLRCHSLSGYGKPSLFSIDVFTNHSWKMTFTMDGTVAELRRLATHKSIDRDPRG
jgi:hypothetical protein